jgi:hypothetical protein
MVVKKQLKEGIVFWTFLVGDSLPTICIFYGIVIRMYFRDHDPPHFHATYGEHEALVSIQGAVILNGKLPAHTARLVKDWAMARQAQLRDNWQRARAGEPLEKIAGLDVD